MAELSTRMRQLVDDIVGASTPAGFDTVSRIFAFVRDELALEVEVPDLPLTLARAEIAVRERRATPGQKAVLFVAMARVAGTPARFAIADLEDRSLGRRSLRRHVFAAFASRGSWSRCDLLLSREAARRLRVAPRELRANEDCLLPRLSDDGHALFRYVSFHGEFDELPLDLLRSRADA